MGALNGLQEAGLVLAWYVSTLLITLFLCLGLGTAIFNYFTVRRFDQYPLAEHLPAVSILVPARNEADNIEACLRSLLAQDYPDFEVLVLNDNSTDETPHILARLAANDTRLQVLQGAPLPEGWLGKNWACHQLEKAASGELILFTDADTLHTPDTLRASVSALLAEQADLVTALPHQQMVSWGERLLVPVMEFGVFMYFPIRLAQRLHWPMLSITIGQFMLFRRSAYEAIGGHAAIRTKQLDDVNLGRRILRFGGEWRLLNGSRNVSCRMYHGYREAVRGLARSIFATFDYRILPYTLVWLLVEMAFLEPVAVLLSSWLHASLTFQALPYAALSVVLSILLWLVAWFRLRFPVYLVLVYPITLMLFIAVLVRSMVQKATWKDRQLAPSRVRWL